MPNPIRLVIISLMLLLPEFALAAQPLALTNQVFVERTQMLPDGRTKTVLTSADQVLPGDQLVFVLRYLNQSGRASDRLMVTNQMPPAVVFQHAGNGALVSVDGGKNWGVLSTLFIAEHNGRRRSARPDDVTHIRWQLSQPVPAGGAGKLTFRGTVR
jgi:hypothetical protein